MHHWENLGWYRFWNNNMADSNAWYVCHISVFVPKETSQQSFIPLSSIDDKFILTNSYNTYFNVISHANDFFSEEIL